MPHWTQRDQEKFVRRNLCETCRRTGVRSFANACARCRRGYTPGSVSAGGAAAGPRPRESVLRRGGGGGGGGGRGGRVVYVHVCRAPMCERDAARHRIYWPVSLRDQQPLCCPHQSRLLLLLLLLHHLLYPPPPPPHRAHAACRKVHIFSASIFLAQPRCYTTRLAPHISHPNHIRVQITTRTSPFPNASLTEWPKAKAALKLQTG